MANTDLIAVVGCGYVGLVTAVGLAEQGLRVQNVDASILAERPKLAPFVAEMRANVAAALGVDVNQVSVKGKSNEKVDAVGRGEAIASHAVVLLAGHRT